jgi:hypothetical protein
VTLHRTATDRLQIERFRWGALWSVGTHPPTIRVSPLHDVPFLEKVIARLGSSAPGGIAVYNVTDPASPTFVQYVNPRDFTAGPYVTAGEDTEGDWEAAGDLGPEGIVFVSEDESPNGKPLLVVANEVSGTTTIYAIG